MELKFRTPVKCQNGHKAFWYWKHSDRHFLQIETIQKPPDNTCGCSKFSIGEGWERDGEDQMFIGLLDFSEEQKEIYQGDILDSNLVKYPDDPSPYVIIFEDGAFRSLRKDWPEKLPKPVVYKRHIEILEDRIIGSTHLTPELIP